LNTKEYNAQYYQGKRNQRKQQVMDRQRDIYRTVETYKLSHGCDICGYSRSSRALQFHHLKDKKHNISRMVTQGRSLSSIFEEIEKCVILCANCHAEEEERLFIEASNNG
jgi:hypothetical protein